MFSRIDEFSDKNKKRSNELFPKNDKALSKNNFSSIAGSINALLEKTIKGMVRFLEGKTKMVFKFICLNTYN